MFIMRIYHAHGCNLGIHLRRLEPSARCWSRTCGLVRAPMWIVRGQALALAMALSIRTSAAHVEATRRNGAAVLKTIFEVKSASDAIFASICTFPDCARNRVVSGFRRWNDREKSR